MAIGGVPAGIYASSAPKECHYILENTEASVLIVENLSKWAKVTTLSLIFDCSPDEPMQTKLLLLNSLDRVLLHC